MKNFSLKALGAFIFAAGLVVAGVAAPASATVFTTSATNIANPGSTNTTAFTATYPATPSTAYTIVGAGVMGISHPTTGQSTFTASATPTACFSGSGVTVTIPSGNPLIGSSISCSVNLYGGAQIRMSSGGTPLPTGSIVQITFAAGSLAFAATGSYSFKTSFEGSGALALSGYIETVTMTDPNYVAPTYTVTFNANGGSGTMAAQSGNAAAALNLNAFTKSGYTFGGWASTQVRADAGTVFLTNGALFGFTASQTLYAIWTPGGGSGSSASANLTLNAATGQLIAGSTVGVSASGLQSTAAYTVTVQSTPQTIGTGNAVSGSVSTNVTLPSGLEAGWHTLTFTSTASDGSAVSSKYYFKISASGTLLSTSSTIPAELANTGIDSTNGIMFLLGGLSLALIGAEMIMIARRKRSN